MTKLIRILMAIAMLVSTAALVACEKKDNSNQPAGQSSTPPKS